MTAVAMRGAKKRAFENCGKSKAASRVLNALIALDCENAVKRVLRSVAVTACPSLTGG